MSFLQKINELFESTNHSSNKIFVMKTPSCPENMDWNYIGFVMPGGKLKIMPDTYIEKAPLPKPGYAGFKKTKISQAIKKMQPKYEEFVLDKDVIVMDKFNNHKPKDCANYVLSVINKNRNIAGKKLIEPMSFNISDIYQAIKFYNKK